MYNKPYISQLYTLYSCILTRYLFTTYVRVCVDGLQNNSTYPIYLHKHTSAKGGGEGGGSPPWSIFFHPPS